MQQALKKSLNKTGKKEGIYFSYVAKQINKKTQLSTSSYCNLTFIFYSYRHKKKNKTTEHKQQSQPLYTSHCEFLSKCVRAHETERRREWRRKEKKKAAE